MANERPSENQNWFLRDITSFNPKVRVDVCNPSFGYLGATNYLLYTVTDKQQKFLNKQLEAYDTIKDSIGGVLETASLLTSNLRGGVGLALIGAGAAGKKLLNTSYESKFGFRNNATVSYTITQPRFSFDMDVSDSLFGDSERVVAASLTGGYGLFHGRLPKVFFSNGFGRSSVDSFYSRFGGGGPSSACAGPIPNLSSELYFMEDLSF